MSDDDIRAAQQRLHLRLKRIVDVMPQLQAIVVIGRDGRPLVSSALDAVPPDLNLTRPRLFQGAGRARHRHLCERRALAADDPASAAISSICRIAAHRRDGSFNGIIAVAVLPSYFEDFYALIGQERRQLLRAWCARTARSWRAIRSARPFEQARSDERLARRRSRAARSHGIFIGRAVADRRQSRRIGFRKLAGFPVYVLAGTEKSAITSEWLSLIMSSHLIFGLPATLLLFAVLGLALQRTQRLHDEAERREAAEAALRQSQRLEAIGQLTGGVAHDFNNLLMIVSGSVQRLRRDAHRREADAPARHDRQRDPARRKPDPPVAGVLAAADAAAAASSICAQRLPELKDMLSRSLRGDIEIRVVVPDGICAVKVDPSEFELALLNLAVNARDAMPSGGTLTITVKPVVLRGKAAEEGLRGEFVAMRVADTGDGIPPEVLAARVRAVLHHQGSRQGHRAGLEPGLWLRQAIRRHRDHHQHGRARHGDHAVPAAHLGSAGAGAAPSDVGAPSRSAPAPCCWSRTMPRSPRSAAAYLEQLGYRVRSGVERAGRARRAGPRARSIWYSPTS